MSNHDDHDDAYSNQLWQKYKQASFLGRYGGASTVGKSKPKPMWKTVTGTVSLYEMSTQHIINAKRRLRDVTDQSGDSIWTTWFKEELLAREGESPTNKDNLTIDQIREARRLRRLLLGLPPEIVTDPVVYHYNNKPTVSLFED